MDERDERMSDRADLLPEEAAVGSEDPAGQAEAILEDSDRRQFERDVDPDTAAGEHRTSADTVEPPG